MLVLKRTKNIFSLLGLFILFAFIFMAMPVSAAEPESYKGMQAFDGDEEIYESFVPDQPLTRTIQADDVEGGHWIRGITNNQVISRYKHYYGFGHASVVNGYGDYDSGGWMPTNVYSPAELTAHPLLMDYSYYDYRY